MRLKNWPAGSLVIVAPLRKTSHWWFSDNSNNYGWLEGNLDVELVCNMALLLEELAKHPRVDPRKIVLYGFSAGAYAISELLTTHQSVIARTIVLGGIHGHGDSATQCQVLALPTKLQQRIPEFEKKWEAYLLRLSSGPNIHPDRMVVVHNTLDTLSYWAPARDIWQAMDDARTWAGMSLLRRKTFSRPASRSFKNGHNYWKVEELIVLRCDPPLTLETRQVFLDQYGGPALRAAPSSSLTLASSSIGALTVSMSLIDALPLSPPPVSQQQSHLSVVTDVNQPWTEEDDEDIPSWATDYGKALAANVISTTSQFSPSTLLHIEEDDDPNHYWATQTMAPARILPQHPVVVASSDLATSLGQPPSSPRASSPDSFHSCSPARSAEEEALFQASVEELFIPMGAQSATIPEESQVVTPLPRFPVAHLKVEEGLHLEPLDAQVDTDYFSDDDYVEESSSSDEEPMDCIAPADRFLTLDRGVHEWHIDHPNDPRDLRAPFLRTLLHDQVADGTGATFHVSTSFPGKEVLESKGADWSKLSPRHLVAFREAKTRAEADLDSEVLYTYPPDTLVFILQTKKLGPVIRALVRFCISDFDTSGPEFGKAREEDFQLLRDEVPCHIFQGFDWAGHCEDLLFGRTTLSWSSIDPESTTEAQDPRFEGFDDKDDMEKTEFMTGMLTQSLPNQATARIKQRIALHPCTTDSSLGVIVPPVAPNDLHGANKDIRSVPLGQLRGITGCVGPIRDCTLKLPPTEEQPNPLDGDEVHWETLQVATSQVVLRSGPS
eukprot:5392091-Amphidinium_carterae.1